MLVESIDDHWTNTLRTTANHPIVSGKKPSPLFWFTPSNLAFEKLITVKIKSAEKQIPVFLEKPELVFEKIWATPDSNDEQPDLKSIID